MHYYQFNIGEYASHTRHLSPIEDIAYRRLLDLSYTTELPLIKDIRQLTRLVNLREYQQEVEDVLKEFFFETEDGWLNNRVVKEIEKTGKKSEQAKNSAAIRWDNERKAKKMQEQCEQHANASVNNANAYENDATNNPLPNTNNPLPITQDKEPIKNIRGSRLSIDWIAPQEFIDYCKTERPDLDSNFIADGFRDYWISVAGSKGVKADWFATWRNWVRRQELAKSKFKNKSDVISDSQFHDWLNSSEKKVMAING